MECNWIIHLYKTYEVIKVINYRFKFQHYVFVLSGTKGKSFGKKDPVLNCLKLHL